MLEELKGNQEKMLEYQNLIQNQSEKLMTLEERNTILE